ncbi:hypothetical protein [Oceanobacillus sp. J11TS1]|uniref:hypothetical protein n=1 Tax=Oceanobacillus sp. J11TS1 TaxID=2807191 RepID=UPI001B178A8A|nr:hypothetical protein [Oceanobacillus sp. J11TS1]GIO22869.1 hypothetical protein J11TS1_14500 [Oceanobacillus sp. J11TS1]
MFGFGFFDVFIIAAILGVQYFLSSRNSVYWGGFIPLVFVVWRTWILINEDENFLAYVLILLVGLAFLIGGWYEGRKALHNKRKQELDKMKSYDIK